MILQEWDSHSGNSNATAKYIKTFNIGTNNDTPLPLKYSKDTEYMYEIFWTNNNEDYRYDKGFSLNYNGNDVIEIPFIKSENVSGEIEEMDINIHASLYLHTWMKIENSFLGITN